MTVGMKNVVKRSVAYDYDMYGNKIRKFICFGDVWKEDEEFVAEKGFDKERYRMRWRC